ncbi:probable small intestine urate exporter isoform X4 [Macaca thibetana thibetana]|uniref:probable small intestine urate exporter isoform X4 n=1 Tax=Macaca thibetana thibetana TaxID=257877 RepID=UPI0021BCE9F9|nr:probable small intestine urate exporter isoform X4 [Macaca thibetana thibetana]
MSTGPDVKATVGDISNDGNLNMAQEECSRKGFCSVRHGLALILQLCNFSIYTQQMNLSIAIPAMVNNTAPPSQPNASTEWPSTDSQDYWNETLKEFKAMVMVLTGQYSIWVKWAPPLERSQLTTIAGSGSMLGSFIVLLVGGLLCQTIGWPYVFYIFGGIGCACCLLWFPLIYDDPVNHPFISAAEKRYIVCSLAQQDCSPGWSLPIRAMIKSLPLWAIVISYFCEYWLFYTIMAYTPTYISSVLQANLRDSGILSALPFVVGCICIILGGLLADFLLSRKILRLITIRKLFTAIGKGEAGHRGECGKLRAASSLFCVCPPTPGVLFPSVILVSLPWVRSSHSMTMTFLVLSSAISSFCESGALVNFLDIAPRYTGFLKGLLQVFAHIAGAISPTAAGFFISQDSEFGWRNVFLLSAAVNISGLVFYLIFGRADVQDWAKEQTFTHL